MLLSECLQGSIHIDTVSKCVHSQGTTWQHTKSGVNTVADLDQLSALVLRC